MEPVIVDCDVLEAAKENVQPLAAGRRVTALSDILSTPHSQRDAKLSATRSRLRFNVQVSLEDQDDNTLDAYCTLVYWTLENYPQGNSAESGLIELLEESTRVLKDDQSGRWRSEFKYLKLWVLYASYVERPSIIFRFLLANDIGSDHALLYEEYASVLERNKRRTQADEIYLLGIARQAQPLDRLKNRHREFQKRMMVSSPIATVSPSPQPSLPAASSGQRRVPLGANKNPLSESPTPSSTPIIPSAASSRLQIFVDPTGSGAEGNAYPDVGTRKIRIKENTKEIGKINGTTIKQAGKTKRLASAGEGSSSKIAIYRDGHEKSPSLSSPAEIKSPVKSSFTPFVDASAVPASAVRFTPYKDDVPLSPQATSSPILADAVMKLKQPAATVSEAEALRRDPLKNYDGVAKDNSDVE